MKEIAESIVASYGQMFFSDNRRFALILFLASFSDPVTGLSGLLSVFVAVMVARWFGFDPALLKSGAYSFNSLLTGLVMGMMYQPGLVFFSVLCLISIFTMLISVSMAQFSIKHKLPYLSIPFIAGVWVLLLSVRSFSEIGFNDRGIYSLVPVEDWVSVGLNQWYHWTNSFNLPSFLDAYLRSLAALFFQTNIIAGILISIGILIYSRIAFSLSVIGFASGYLFFFFAGLQLGQVQYGFIGFNFILTAIALGGFFLVPSPRSYLLAIGSSLLIAVLISAFTILLSRWDLPMYSLPFSILVVLLLFVLQLRHKTMGLDLVEFQYFSPEKNLYEFSNSRDRFANQTFVQVHLPFFGEWKVSQGHNGKITHKDDYRFALDFVVADETGKTWKFPGTDPSHFYCYNLPVLAPAAGMVVYLNDDIEDNPVGKVDIGHNWGNTIIIQHAEGLYSKISHMKRGSFKVKVGDYLRRGDLLATVGNSGRSPEPHIHWQLQATPFVGSKTLQYPVSYYLSLKAGKYEYHSFDYPIEGDTITRISTTALLRNAFQFIPGQKLKFQFTTSTGKIEMTEWEVFVNSYNQSYLWCAANKSTAWFVNNDTVFYFTGFSGDRNSLLYYFYLGAQRVLLGYYPALTLTDHIPLSGFYNGVAKFLQDFIAPFSIFLKVNYRSTFSEIDSVNQPGYIQMKSSVSAFSGNSAKRNVDFVFELNNKGIAGFKIIQKGQTQKAICVN